MFRSLFVLGLLSAFIFGCGTRSIAIYEGETPSFDLESFFNGKVEGWGIVLNRNNDVVKRFKVNVEGYFSADKSSGKLIEKFFWSDGKREKRVWNLKKTADNEWEGTSYGVIGTARGVASGNALKWSYRYDLILEGSFLNKLSVDFDDWMFLVEDNVLMNRAVFSKFGLKLGTVIITFKKSNG